MPWEIAQPKPDRCVLPSRQSRRAGLAHIVQRAQGDVITIGDFSGAINKRSYTLAETSVNLISDEVSVTPEAPIKRLDMWLANA